MLSIKTVRIAKILLYEFCVTIFSLWFFIIDSVGWHVNMASLGTQCLHCISLKEQEGKESKRICSKVGMTNRFFVHIRVGFKFCYLVCIGLLSIPIFSMHVWDYCVLPYDQYARMGLLCIPIWIVCTYEIIVYSHMISMHVWDYCVFPYD